jgi:hypothetical protein
LIRPKNDQTSLLRIDADSLVRIAMSFMIGNVIDEDLIIPTIILVIRTEGLRKIEDVDLAARCGMYCVITSLPESWRVPAGV